jgi:hypothetical protein
MIILLCHNNIENHILKFHLDGFYKNRFYLIKIVYFLTK